jgi:hypothetical protein
MKCFRVIVKPVELKSRLTEKRELPIGLHENQGTAISRDAKTATPRLHCRTSSIFPRFLAATWFLPSFITAWFDFALDVFFGASYITKYASQKLFVKTKKDNGRQ